MNIFIICMEKLKVIRLLTITGIIIIPLISSCFTNSVSSHKIWRNQRKEIIFLNYPKYICDGELKKDNNYEKLQKFFNNCSNPKDFYDKIQKNVYDAYKETNTDIPNTQRKLTNIVNEITECNATLDCVDQSLLFVAGVKAMFSNYDKQLKQYIIKDGLGNFKIEIWRSFDLHPPIFFHRSHVQIIVDKWNGTDTFQINNKTLDKIETDTWEDEFREFDKRNDCLFYPFFAAKLNSIIYTKSTLQYC